MLELTKHKAWSFSSTRSIIQLLSWLVHFWRSYLLLHCICKLILLRGILVDLLFFLYHRLTQSSIDFRTHWSWVSGRIHTRIGEWLCKRTCYIHIIGRLWMLHVLRSLLVILVKIIFFNTYSRITLIRINSVSYLFYWTKVLHSMIRLLMAHFHSLASWCHLYTITPRICLSSWQI